MLVNPTGPVVPISEFASGPYDSSEDHLPLFNMALARLRDYGGGTIFLDDPAYGVSDTIAIPHNHIALLGRGCGARRSGSNNIRNSAATRIFASANFPTTSGKSLIAWEPTSGSQFGVIGGGISGIMLDGQNRAARGLSVLSSHDMSFDRVHVYACVEANIWNGPFLGTLTAGDYASRGHIWRQIKAHNTSIANNTAYCLMMTGVEGVGDACINQFHNCDFVSRNQNAVRMENSDFHQFFLCTLTSEVGGAALVDGLGSGFFGLDLCSQTQNPSGVARYSQFYGCQINDILLRASQSAGLRAPYAIEVFANSFDNAGGLVYAETPANGGEAGQMIVHDWNGIKIYGNRNYNVGPLYNLQLKAAQETPSREDGIDKVWSSDVDSALSVRYGSDGSVKVLGAAPRRRKS